MQKVYIVLKNNKQEGPYSLQELQQIDLKPTDLIWVEGRSAAWCYPSEIKELQALNYTKPGSITDVREERYAPATTREPHKKEAKKVFVSLPGGKEKRVEANGKPPETNIEEKAEALQQRILSNQAPAPNTSDNVVETRLQRSMDDVAGDFANWAIQYKARKKNFQINKQKIALAAFILMVVVAAGYLLYPNAPSQNTTAVREEQPIMKDLPVTEDINPDLAFENTAPASVEKETPIKQNNSKYSTPDPNIQKERTNLTVIDKRRQEPSINESTAPVIEEKSEEIIGKKEPEKKKSIGEAIDGFFDKFKNKNKESAEGSATNSEARQSTKRAEGENAATETIDVTSQVKVSTNAPRENWMLGIKGQKLILQNNSKALIQSAWVTVEYFSEDETLLDTKRIEFKNIKPLQNVTQPLPDHRLASYTTQQVTTATGQVRATN